MLGQLGGVFLQLREVLERIGIVQFAAVDETHEQIAPLGTVPGLIKQGILTMKNGSLPGALDKVGIQRRTGWVKKEG